MNTTMNAQDWLDTSLYPFENKYIPLETGKMHYVDEGKGEVILFVHGTPTWSFLYRDFLKELSKTHRCIAVDHIGFGLSEKPHDFEGTPQAHSRNLEEFISKLNLNNITLVVHDFGGPIGLGAALQDPDRIKQIVLFNTWLWGTKHEKSIQKIDKTIRSGFGKFLYLNLNISPKVLLKKGFSDKKNLPKQVNQHYIKPFPDRTSRYSLLNLAKSLRGSSDWYEQQWLQLDKLADKSWLILWGTADKFITTKHLDKWKTRLPAATVRPFECGHFVQEEQTAESIDAILSFIR